MIAREVKGLSPMHNRSLVFFDLEHFGFKVKHGVCEMAAIKRAQGPPPYREEKLDLKVHMTDYEIEHGDPKAIEINGFNKGEWIGATPKTEAFTLMFNFIAAHTLVGFNVENDLRKLEAEFDASDIPLAGKTLWRLREDDSSIVINPYRARWIQGLEMATLLRAAYPDWERYNLAYACEKLDIEPEGVHRAMGGAERTKQIWDKLWQSA